MEEFDRLFAVNAKSVYLTARHVVPRMKAAGGGVILNMASTAGVSPRPRLTWYNATKGWVITATRSMAVELAPAGIRVNALNPVAGETPLLKTFLGEDTPERRAAFLATIPLGRFSTPEDMGNAACYLCSDEAAMVTALQNGDIAGAGLDVFEKEPTVAEALTLTGSGTGPRTGRLERSGRFTGLLPSPAPPALPVREARGRRARAVPSRASAAAACRDRGAG